MIKQVRRKDLTFWQKTYIPEIVKGMVLTMRHFFSPKFTRQYPEERWNPPSSFRGRPVLVEEQGVERCKSAEDDLEAAQENLNESLRDLESILRERDEVRAAYDSALAAEAEARPV